MDYEREIEDLKRRIETLESEVEVLKAGKKEGTVYPVHLEKVFDLGARLKGKPESVQEQQPPFFKEELEALTDWEHLIAKVWLPRIFFGCFVIGDYLGI